MGFGGLGTEPGARSTECTNARGEKPSLILYVRTWSSQKPCHPLPYLPWNIVVVVSVPGLALAGAIPTGSPELCVNVKPCHEA